MWGKIFPQCSSAYLREGGRFLFRVCKQFYKGKMKESKSILTNINIAAFAAAALILAAGCGKGGEQTAPKEAQAPVVKVMNPIKKKVDMWDEYTARIDALAFVELRARVSGYLEKVYFKEGQEVKVGDMLFRIDQRPYQAALDSCKAGVKEVEARLSLAQNNLKRAKDLLAANTISKETYETRNSELLAAQAELLNAKAKLRDAELNLEFTEIRAPISGKVGEALVDPGNLITANSTLLTTIVKSDVVQAYFEISERDVMNYKKNGLFDKIDIIKKTGPVVELQMMENPGNKTKRGVLNYYDNRIGVETSSLTLRADFDNKDGMLSPGMFAKARVLSAEQVEVMMLPEDIIGTDLINRYVIVVDENNVAKYKAVNVGKLLGKYRIIEGGLDFGDKVVSVGLQRAAPGSKVTPEFEKAQ